MEVDRRLKSLPGEKVDYLTFVPDGEPTLDVNLGREISLLKPLGIKVAVLTNSSLIFREDVRGDLAKADLVSLKVDAISEDVWRKINRPHPSLRLGEILEGMLRFAKVFHGRLITETMLIAGVNDGEDEIRGIAGFLSRLKPDKAYVAIPTRPPAEGWAKPASEEAVNLAYQAFSEALGEGKVEYLVSYEEESFTITGNLEQDLLGIASVHPLREEIVDSLLKKAGADRSLLEKLVRDGKLVKLTYRGRNFYVRKFSNR